MEVRIACGWCGGDDVSRDAWADWDVATQSWTLRHVLDDGYCHRCGAWRGLETVALDEAQPVAT